jgi:hypothetical protein
LPARKASDADGQSQSIANGDLLITRIAFREDLHLILDGVTIYALKAMLLAEPARAAWLEQIVKGVTHRFGRGAETMPEDQLLLGLEEAEQVEASSDAATDGANAAERCTGWART